MSATTRLPRGLFSSDLDEITQSLLKTSLRMEDEHEQRRELVRRGLAAMEALVLAPKVNFRVFGENAVLAVLARAVGPRGIRELLEEGGLEFTLWQSSPAHLVSTPGKPARKGLLPLVPMTHTSAPHRDPFASAELGLRGWAPWMLPSDAKPIARLAAERTSLVDLKLAPLACERVHNAYRHGLLTSRGFDRNVHFDDLDEPQRAALDDIAGDVHRMAVAFGQGLEIHDDTEGWASLMAACARLQDGDRIVEVGQKIIRLERLPSIADLLLYQVISHADIPKIRRRKETLEFRKWLWGQPDPTDAAKVSEAYLAALVPKADVRDSRWFKAGRIAIVGAVGSAVGTAVAGPIGSALGAAVASTAAGIATSLVDGFWLDALLAKPNPRRLATDVLMPLVTARTQGLSPLPTDLTGSPSSNRAESIPAVRVRLSKEPAASQERHSIPPASDSAGQRPDDQDRRDRNRRKAQRKAQGAARRRHR